MKAALLLAFILFLQYQWLLFPNGCFLEYFLGNGMLPLTAGDMMTLHLFLTTISNKHFDYMQYLAKKRGVILSMFILFPVLVRQKQPQSPQEVHEVHSSSCLAG